MASKKKTASAAETAEITSNTAKVQFDDMIPHPPQKMDPRIKALWVADLRSGKYKQITGTLRRLHEKAIKGARKGDVQGFCCLGVLADRFSRSKANVDKFKWDNDDFGEVSYEESNFDGETGVTPQCVVDWSKLPEQDPYIPVAGLWKNSAYKAMLNKKKISKSGGSTGDGMITLAELNDFGFTFNQIADIIDEHL